MNIVNTAFVGSLIVAKIMISNLVFYKALIGIVSTLQAVSIFLCAAALIQADDEKGRELLEIDNEPIMVGLCLMVFIWILWLIINYLFLAIYYAKIVM